MAQIHTIGILTFDTLQNRASFDNTLLRQAAIKNGNKACLYVAQNFQHTFQHNALSLLYQNRLFKPPHIMVVRANILSDVDLHMSIVKQLQLLGVPVVNNSLPIARAKNKIRTLQILAHEGIPVPKTVVVSDVRYLDKAINQLGSFPLIVKLAYGSFGNGVSILESRRSLRSFFDLVVAADSARVIPIPILIQEYVKEAKGKDIRVFIVGEKIVAAMERSAPRGEFRANFSLGGSVGLVNLTKEERAISVKAAALLGLDVAGVDIIRTATGPRILEVNANPGLKGITQATGIDVAGHIIRLAEKRIKAPKNGKTMMTMSG